MDEERDSDEILAYYGNNPQSDSEKPSDAPQNPCEENSAISENAFDKSADNSEKPIAENADSVSKKPPLLPILTALAAAAVITAGFLVGRFVMPAPKKIIDSSKKSQLKTDSAYLAAKSENEALNAQIAGLESDNQRIEDTFNDIIEYQKQYDELKAEYESVSERLEDANDALSNARQTLESAQKSLDALRAKTVTLSPGTYTAGVHIPAGVYLVTGNGSILTAGSDKTLKTNMLLDKTTPFRCELDENDTIKLSAEAEFKPEAGNDG